MAYTVIAERVSFLLWVSTFARHRRRRCTPHQPYALELEVCNASEVPAEFAFDLGRLTVSTSGSDPLGHLASQTDGDGGGCNIQVSPGKAVAPPSGSVRCTVRRPRIVALARLVFVLLLHESSPHNRGGRTADA